MKIAIPVANGLLNLHFGHCKAFAIMEVDSDTKQISARTDIDAPPHEPGVLPRWLGERDVDLVITGGMGQQAKTLFAQQSIDVIVGAPADTPENLVQSYLDGSLVSGVNACDH